MKKHLTITPHQRLNNFECAGVIHHSKRSPGMRIHTLFAVGVFPVFQFLAAAQSLTEAKKGKLEPSIGLLKLIKLAANLKPILAALLGVAMATSASATNIPLNNASLESPSYNTGGPYPGWYGVWSEAAQFTGWTVSGPDGAAPVAHNGSQGLWNCWGYGWCGLSQNSAYTVQAAGETLTSAVWSKTESNVGPNGVGFRVELRLNGSQASVTQSNFPAGTDWTQITATYVTTAADIGKTVGISFGTDGGANASNPNYCFMDDASLATSGSLPPSAGGTASPNPANLGNTVLFTVTVTNGTSPTISSVTLNTSPIGGSSSLALVSAGGNVYTNRVTVTSATDLYNPIPLQVTVVDSLSHTGYASISIRVNPPPDLTVPNGNMELPAVGAWSTTLPLNWTWRAGGGVSAVGLTSTGGANGSQQCLYGNQLAGTLVSPVLSGTFTNTGNAALTYWAKCMNTGYYSITARLLIDGHVVASRPDTLQSGPWTQLTLNYQVTPADVEKAIQVHFSFSGSGAWQGFLDEVSLALSNSLIFSPTNLVQAETNSICRVSVFLSQPATNTVSVNHFRAGGTAVPGTDFNYTPGTLTFAPGVVSNSFSFSVVNNSTYEAAKTVVFGLTNASNTMIGTYSNQTVLIIDPEDHPAPRNFYVDSVSGSDSNSGTNLAAPWRSLTNVNATTFRSGDNILFKAGSVWTGQLHPLGSGDYNAQITLNMYGSGAKPVINGGGIAGGVFYLLNQQYWTINNLELSNYGSTSIPKKQGMLIKNDCVGTLNRIYIRNCYIHDVNGVMDGYVDGKESGGIVFNITGSNLSVPSKWNDLRIENNVIRDVVREGILLQSLWVNKPQDPNTYWDGCGAYYPSTQVYIASNILERIGGDGIIPWAVNGAVVEYNYVRQSNWNTPGQGHAALWPYICENIVFQFNEVCETKTPYDGMALDFDNSNQNCIYQYNYCHDNEGGFLNMCCDGNANGNIARYNISQNDGCISGGRVFLVHGDGNHGYQVYNNTIFVSNVNPPVFQQGASSYGSDIAFYNNIIVNMGSGSVAQLGGCTFDYNLFYGNGWIGGDPNKILANPQLVAAGSASNGLASVTGYKLMTNSPALHAGRIVTDNGGRDYWGNTIAASTAPNIGAYNGAGFPEIPTVGTNLAWSVSGTNLVLNWPANYTGWRLLVQTGHLAYGISSNTNDWQTVINSTQTNQIILPMNRSEEFFKMIYP